jgi:hypothetical protein
MQCNRIECRSCGSEGTSFNHQPSTINHQPPTTISFMAHTPLPDTGLQLTTTETTGDEHDCNDMAADAIVLTLPPSSCPTPLPAVSIMNSIEQSRTSASDSHALACTDMAVSNTDTKPPPQSVTSLTYKATPLTPETSKTVTTTLYGTSIRVKVTDASTTSRHDMTIGIKGRIGIMHVYPPCHPFFMQGHTVSRLCQMPHLCDRATTSIQCASLGLLNLVNAPRY